MSGSDSGAPGTATLSEKDMAAATAELRTQLRLDGSREEALLRGCVGAATGSCELFTGRVLVARPVAERRTASAAWTRLRGAPVRGIVGVSMLDAAGVPVALVPDAFAVDIDANGDGWVRLSVSAGGRMLVAYEAGLAAEWSGLPAPLRGGVLRLAGHLYAERGNEGEPVPASVSALWRPFRRIAFGGAHDVRPRPGAWGRVA